jgi:hypothetical protein
MLDNNRAAKAIAAGGRQLVQLHTDGSIWRSRGTPCNGNFLSRLGTARRQSSHGFGRRDVGQDLSAAQRRQHLALPRHALQRRFLPELGKGSSDDLFKTAR